MPYYPHNVCGLCSDIPLFIPDFGNLGHLVLYFLLVFWKFVSVLIFMENQLFAS